MTTHRLHFTILAAVMFCAGSAGGADGGDVVLNEREIPAWDLPATAGENWRFYPIEWTVEPLFDGQRDDFELTAVLTVDARQEKYRVEVHEGLSLFGRGFDGREMTLELYVKTLGLDGAFTVEVDRPAKLVSRTFSGTTETWDLVRLKLAPKPSDPCVEIHFVLDAENGKTGSVWIDDISFLPTP